ncbi:hypothetical protein K503DRAFT_315642 [Rhizopogon vinicolor AM-OR11-026]|uniref:Secreted protein n=1 Tax=Rhizopogon vinicolor AM-OR11-026 TaxID=1314800 RepID=A0A1B7MUH6_9AGAM|nr:hypothetical protein K503DRAFT_315642 [Rhizopogon vinicolor AM-OR11-026]
MISSRVPKLCGVLCVCLDGTLCAELGLYRHAHFVVCAVFNAIPSPRNIECTGRTMKLLPSTILLVSTLCELHGFRVV